MSIKMSKEEYKKYVDKKTPNSKMGKNLFNAFWVGGLVCVIAQCFCELFKMLNFDKQSASTLTSVVMIFLGVFLTGIHLYDKIAKFAGAGTLVPITGFANSVVSPQMEFKTEGHILGIAPKVFSIAGPVILFGTISSVGAGIIYYILSFI